MNKLACTVLILGLIVPFFAHAYTGVTIVLSASTPTNQEFVENFKDELIRTKNTGFRLTVIDLQDLEKLVVAENSELVIALGVKALDAASSLNFLISISLTLKRFAARLTIFSSVPPRVVWAAREIVFSSTKSPTMASACLSAKGPHCQVLGCG